jgi:hypothetical protein
MEEDLGDQDPHGVVGLVKKKNCINDFLELVLKPAS